MSGGVGSEFVTVADLSAKLAEAIDVSNAQQVALANSSLTLAEAMAARMLGTSTLEEQVDLVSTLTLRRRRPFIEMEEGPTVAVSQVSSVTQGGTSVDASVLRMPHPWTLARTDEDWPSGTEIVITFTPGFRVESGGSTMPQQIKEMILLIAADAYQNPDQRKIMERLGDYQYMTAFGGNQDQALRAVSDAAVLLSEGWRNPVI